MAVQFEIEAVVNITNRGYYVFARHLTPGQSFYVTDKSFLGGVELSKFIAQPRSTNDLGEQRSDLFVFHLKNEKDHSKLQRDSIVELIPGDTISFLKPWYPDQTDLTVQIHKEINKKHILYGKIVQTIGRRQDNDDVLFEVSNADFKYAMVHLTWSSKTQDDPNYPRTEIYSNWQEVYQDRIIKDHAGWEDHSDSCTGITT